MYKLISMFFAFVILLAGFAIPVAAQAQGSKPPKYYVSLGTSLAAGVQADKKTGAPIVTDDAYTDQIYQRVKGQIPNLQHVKLGCPFETSHSMVDGVGSVCYVNKPSQLETAEAFMKAHKGEIAFITIDIGANDLLPCLTVQNIDGCVAGVLGQF